ncbi:MAG: NAD-dependent epimerase/dehydratase family protein [Prolixibacteraceae bacterium]|jgi:UDP-glucuronate 4-epimerase
MKILVTGAAGFIGFHTVKHFAEKGNRVVGIDNINNYYDVELKYARLAENGISKELIQNHQSVQSTEYPNYRFVKTDLQDKVFIDKLFEIEHFDGICHLAAQAGVRHSIDNPYAYINSNIIGFMNILEACRFYPVKHLVYASSSSVYGLNTKVPYSESDMVDSPVSLYAASKRSNELMAHTYSKLYNIPTTGVRFFTVYGPWGRPDMAPFLFMDSIVNQKPIKVFNYGKLSRDFTYIDDIIDGLSVIIDHAPASEIPSKIYNIGAGKPVQLLDFIAAIENVTGKTAIKQMVEMQPGDVYQTYADTTALEQNFNYKPKTSMMDGVNILYQWYISYSKRFEKRSTYQ